MRKYQTVVIFSPAVSELQLRQEVARVHEVLASNGANEIQVENWGRRELSYRMKKERFGTYIHFGYQSGNQVIVNEVQRVLGIMDSVLKYQTHNMSVKKRKVKASPLRKRSTAFDDGYEDRPDLDY